jgi:hypothetical protein
MEAGDRATDEHWRVAHRVAVRAIGALNDRGPTAQDAEGAHDVAVDDRRRSPTSCSRGMDALVATKGAALDLR